MRLLRNYKLIFNSIAERIRIFIKNFILEIAKIRDDNSSNITFTRNCVNKLRVIARVRRSFICVISISPL